MDEELRKRLIMDAFAMAGQFNQKDDGKRQHDAHGRPIYGDPVEFWGNTYKQMKSFEEASRKRLEEERK